MSSPPPRGVPGLLPWLLAGAALFGLAAVGGFGAAYLVTTAQAVPTVDPARLPTPTPTKAATKSPGTATPSPSTSPVTSATATPAPVPPSSATPSEAVASPSGTPAPSATPIRYVVKRGDKLNLIADQFHTTVDAIVALNNIKDPNHIEAGQVLLIPVP